MVSSEGINFPFIIFDKVLGLIPLSFAKSPQDNFKSKSIERRLLAILSLHILCISIKHKCYTTITLIRYYVNHQHTFFSPSSDRACFSFLCTKFRRMRFPPIRTLSTVPKPFLMAYRDSFQKKRKNINFHP